MQTIPGWQLVSIASISCWIFFSSFCDLTRKIRSFVQPWISHYVIEGTSLILEVQGFRHGSLDTIFSAASFIVSVPFYTTFLPLLFWSGHSKLARQMTLLMAFCDYVGNAAKDLMSAPRPSCPPARRVTATKDEKEHALEYGLPSSHTINTVCLSGYLFHYILVGNNEVRSAVIGTSMSCVLGAFIGFGRIYLGMHSLVDVLAGLIMGILILPVWMLIDEYVDDFIVSGENVASFSAMLSLLLLFAYPTPELPTPSFEYHTAFSGVAFGIVYGIHQTYLQFHHENVPRVLSPQLTLPMFVGRIFVGIPTILLVKFCGRAIAKWMLPIICSVVGLPVKSSSYLPKLKDSCNYCKLEGAQLGPLKMMIFPQEYDIDTAIRFVHYVGLAWSVVDLVPSLFVLFSL